MISPGKLKLMLTKSDLDKYELDAATMDSEDTMTRQAFRTLLADVKRVSGFDASNEKVFIQLYPSRDGGAEIYITRLTKPSDKVRDAAAIKVTGVYRFDNISLMLEACSRIPDGALPDASTAWQSGDGYYLITETSLSYRELNSDKRERLSELLIGYSRPINSPAATAFLKEHGECLVERDAVATLAELA